MKQILAVDLISQYERIKSEIDEAVLQIVGSGNYINGKAVADFSDALSALIGTKFAVPCANCTDALQLSIMALELQTGDEVIVPNFTYIAAAEAIAMLGLVPVLVDIDPKTFNIDPDKIASAISVKTKAIIPVHLFGQSCDMAPILKIAKENNLFVIEDNAQSIGAEYTFPDGKKRKTGNMGVIGALSFFPTKNLGCMGDGGALLTNDQTLAEKLRKLTLHGQSQKYVHEYVGCNSRLDTLQAAILNVKIRHLDEFTQARQNLAKRYDDALKSRPDLLDIPFRNPASTHVYNQYTVIVKAGKRDDLKKYLLENGIPSTVYYPLPLNRQPALRGIFKTGSDLSESEKISASVLSLPMHTEMDEQQTEYIIEKLLKYE
ncbi:MAG: DegT/DnrJ/EryC1/StrS family aminotransferase [Dysgonamonadaceae bacterium]|jgi:dTDP-4-amino-4,6-dideoxygalactose transaminase|nr:DegT/DnrJ/EryC1/StrS family aminotransferase [Dysgonamonadaceae bacterium]